VQDTGEQCDDGAQNSDVVPDACRTNCLAAHCGDSVRDTGEQCDQGGDTATCDGDCTTVQCGDGYINPAAGEQCEEGGVDTATCDRDCTFPVCGDGLVNEAAGEQCDVGIDSCLGGTTCIDCRCI
jgi:hypothetical protein